MAEAIAKIGIISCSGEEIPEGTISRLATRRVLEGLRPQQTVTLCLPLFLAGDGGERRFAQEHPTITVDGCDKLCAKRGTEQFSGRVSASPGTAPDATTAADGLVVYYFHSTTRCPTCQSIESQAKDTVHADFASQLAGREIVWKVLNYEQSMNAALTKKFEIQMPVVVLAKMKAGQIEDWKRLDQVWALVGDKPAFAKYLHEQIAKMLDLDKQPASVESKSSAPAIPQPSGRASQGDSGENPPAIPVPE